MSVAPVFAVVTQNRPRAKRIDDLFDLLSHRYRRATIRVLANRDERLAVERLAERLAAETVESPTSDDVRKVHISLQHCHLPKLADAGVVEYDKDAQRVGLSDTHPFEAEWREARSWFDRFGGSAPKRSETP